VHTTYLDKTTGVARNDSGLDLASEVALKALRHTIITSQCDEQGYVEWECRCLWCADDTRYLRSHR
jgi:hypothetical protein